MKTEYILSVYYMPKELGYFDDMFPKDKIIKKIVKRDYDGSGYGFGERDLSFTFKTLKSLENAYNRLKANKKKLKIYFKAYDSNYEKEIKF